MHESFIGSTLVLAAGFLLTAISRKNRDVLLYRGVLPAVAFALGAGLLAKSTDYGLSARDGQALLNFVGTLIIGLVIGAGWGFVYRIFIMAR